MKRTITIQVMDDGEGSVGIEVAVVPPIPFAVRMTTSLEQVVKAMLDEAASFGVIARVKE